MIHIPVSIGELADKITILDIKRKKIADPEKLGNINKEYVELVMIYEQIPKDDSIAAMVAELREVNTALWDIEDRIRECGKACEFGEEFIELARSVYLHNDRRSRIKYLINKALNSELIEEKSYS